ncbi:hypothetical protein KKB44_05315 [Candidatus Micrarchaeota archaeon]|nr:hypothetical protein [Candidatus Micrarchaeota archaeon]
MTQKLLLVDCEIKETKRGLQRSCYAELTLMKLARKHGFHLDRFLLVDHPDMRKERVEKVFSEGNYPGIIINGSSFLNPLYDELGSGRFNSTVLRIIEHAFESSIPLLGICYGHLMIARFLGERLPVRLLRVGFVETELTEKGQQHWVFAGVPARVLTPQFHAVAIREAKYSEVLAKSGIITQAIACNNAIGLQFHPDFHGDVDGKGTGAAKYFYETDFEFRKYHDLYRKFSRKTPVIEPDGASNIYATNNLPLLNFVSHCLRR